LTPFAENHGETNGGALVDDEDAPDDAAEAEDAESEEDDEPEELEEDRTPEDTTPADEDSPNTELPGVALLLSCAPLDDRLTAALPELPDEGAVQTPS